MHDFSGSLGAFYADVIATGYERHRRRDLGVRPQRARERERRQRPWPRHRDVRDGEGHHRRPGADAELDHGLLDAANLEAGQDLKVTTDYRDILSEIVQNRFGNPNLDVVFPAWTPTMLGVTR